jgi:hypothetical protein
MSGPAQLELIKLASSTENTPELKKYWERRYQEILDQKLFFLNNKTEEIVTKNQELQINSPFTTFGELILTNHLDQQNELDRSKLQRTIETSVRLLDSLLDCINFTPEAKKVVQSYRKIALGIADFREYLKIVNPSSELEEIDNLGSFISSNAYRSSESLAEEKGSCGSWSNIKKSLRPKSFEYWYNVENGEIKNGLEISEEWDQKSIQQSKFEIVPRRNSHLLSYPPNYEWQIWGDRETKVTPQETGQKSERSEEIKQAISSANQKTTPEAVQAEPRFQEGELVKIKNSDNSRRGKVYQIIEVVSNDNRYKYRLTGNNETIENYLWGEIDLETVDLEEILKKLNNSEKSKIESFRPANKVHTLIFNESGTHILTESDNGGKLELPGQELKPETTPERTIIHAVKDKYGIKTRLIKEIGSATSKEKGRTDSTLHLGFLFESVENLPSNLRWEKITSKKLSTYIRILIHKYNKTAAQEKLTRSNLQKEVSKIREEKEKEVENIKNYLQTQHSQEINSLKEQNLSESNQKVFQQTEKLKEDNKNLSNKNTELNQKILDLEKQIQRLNEEKKSILQDEKNVIHSYGKSVDIKQQSVNYDDKISNSMSKYTLKLEQLVQTNAFGNVTVVLQYAQEGLRVVSVFGENVDKDLKHALDTVLGIVNFMLAKKLTPQEISEQLEKEPEDGVHLPLNDLLTVVAAAMKEAPENADNINNSILDEIVDTAKDEIIAKAIQSNPEQAKPQIPSNEGGKSQPQNNQQQPRQNQPKQSVFNPFR